MQEFWRKIAKTYGQANDLEEMMRDYSATLIKSLSQKNDSILDFGCGNGRVISKIIDNDKSLLITGVDYSKEMLSEASKINYPNLNLINNNIISFLSNSKKKKYNFILSLNTLHNLSSRNDIVIFLNNISLLMDKEAFLIFDVRNRFNPFISRGYKKSRSQGYDFFTFSYLKAIKMLKKNNFDILKIEPIHYTSLEQAGKDNLPLIIRLFYKIYLKITRFTFFSPYILILAKKKNPKFVDIIWGYHEQLAKLSPVENYHMQALEVANSLGYDLDILLINSAANIKNDPNFANRANICHYESIFKYIFFLFRNRKSLIYANTYTWQSFLAPFICRRVIFMGHDSVVRKNWKKQLIQDFVFRFFYKIRVISEGEKIFLEKRGIKSKKIFVIPLAIDVNNFYFSDKVARNNLVFLGNVTPDKNIKDILLALNEVVKMFPNLKLEIFGEIRDANFYSIVDSLGLKNNIIIHGFVPHSSLAPYLRKTLIYVNSSISEGQCLAAYEAVLAGNALCLPNTISFTDVFKDSALFHNLYDSSQLAKNIIKYLTDINLINNNVLCGQNYVLDNYTKEKINNQVEKLFS